LDAPLYQLFGLVVLVQLQAKVRVGIEDNGVVWEALGSLVVELDGLFKIELLRELFSLLYEL
jgi:hypothetical protein